MIRRILLVAAAAVALVLVPSVAMAYNAPGYSSSVSDPTPAVGQSVTITVHGNPNEAIRLVVTSPDGVTTYRGMTNASGVATFTFKAGSAGTITVQAFNAANKLVSDQILTVGGAVGNDNSGVGNDNSGVGEQLSHTGFEGLPLAAGGGVLVLAGAGAVIVARRRRSAQVPA